MAIKISTTNVENKPVLEQIKDFTAIADMMKDRCQGISVKGKGSDDSKFDGFVYVDFDMNKTSVDELNAFAKLLKFTKIDTFEDGDFCDVYAKIFDGVKTVLKINYLFVPKSEAHLVAGIGYNESCEEYFE